NRPGASTMNKHSCLAVTAFLFLTLAAWAAEPTQEEQALAAFQRAGAKVRRDAASRVVWVQFGCGSSVKNADLAHLKNFPDIQELILHGEGVTDAGMEQVKNLPNLKSLTLIRVRVTDQGLEHLKAMTSLRQVYIRFTGISQAGSRELVKALP